MSDKTTHLVLLPAAEIGKQLAAFEALKLQMADLLSYAKQSNDCLIFAFEQVAIKNQCPNSLVLANYAKESDSHISLALQTLSLLSPPGNRKRRTQDKAGVLS